MGIGGSLVGRSGLGLGEETIFAECQRFARDQREDVELETSHQPGLRRAGRTVVYTDHYLAKSMAHVKWGREFRAVVGWRIQDAESNMSVVVLLNHIR